MSVGLPFLMHFGSKPLSEAGALVLTPLSISAFPEVRRKSGLVPSGPANVPEVLLLDGIASVPPLELQAAVGACDDPARRRVPRRPGGDRDVVDHGEALRLVSFCEVDLAGIGRPRVGGVPPV